MRIAGKPVSAFDSNHQINNFFGGKPFFLGLALDRRPSMC